MKATDYLYNLEERGKLAFNLGEFVQKTGLPNQRAWDTLYYFKKKGLLVRPVKGLYVLVPTQYRQIGSLPAQELLPLAMQHLGCTYYAALLTAAKYHGASHQPPHIFQVICSKRIYKRWVIGEVVIEFTYKAKIDEEEIEKKTVRTGYLNISSPEQTAKDLFLYPNKSGGINHQATVLSELVEAIRPDRLIRLIQKDKETSWARRMGYILSKIDTFEEERKEEIIQAISSSLNKATLSYLPLAPEIPVAGAPKNEDWKIIENTTVESDL